MGGVLPLLEGDRPSTPSRYLAKILQIFSQIAYTILFLPVELTVKTMRTAVSAVMVGYVTLVHHPLVSLVSLVSLVVLV